MISSHLRRLAVAGAAAAAAAALAPASSATTTTATFSVIAGVQTTCIIAANTLSFGSYVNSTDDGTGIVTVNCSLTTPYNIGLNAGTSTGATVTTRKMTGPGGALLNYNLFQDSAHTLNWGNTVGTDTVSGIGNGVDQSYTVYGVLPAGQNVPPGSYTDTITATLTF